MVNTYLTLDVKKPADVWVKKLKSAAGERYPLVVTGSGAPLFYPNVYIVAMRRAVGLPSSTVARASH